MTAPNGYHRLAAIIGSYPDLAICRRFMSLNAYNVLSLQAELVHLEEEFTDLVLEDRDSKEPEKASFEFSIFSLKDTGDKLDTGFQWQKIQEIRAKLQEYCMCLPFRPLPILTNMLLLRPDDACERFRHLALSSAANASDLTALRNWFERKDGGNFSLEGIEPFPWTQEKYTKDLTSLTARDKHQDTLSRWIESYVMRVYHDTLGYRWKDPISLAECANLPQQPLHYYPSSHISNAINALSTILSSLLPTMSIFALYFIHSPLARLGAIAAFTLLFSAVLTLVAKARRIDCFAATTAFAAIQVVFVGVGNM